MSQIAVEHIDKNYGKLSALSNISFEVEEGELFGFIGPDGAGKTTLFRILVTLLLPDKGSAIVCGYDTVKDYKTLRNITGYMPGKFSLYQDLSVEENLKFFAGIFGTTIQQNYDLIKDIYSQIEPFKNRRAGALSGGMKQKLALSCALIHKPRVLFLDEPTTGVDAVSRREFWEMLKRLKKAGITIVVSTPYMDEASLCDRVALIQNGSIMMIEKPEAIAASFPGELYAIKTGNTYRLISDLLKFQDCKSAYIFGQYVHYTPINKVTDTETIRQYLENLNHNHIEIRKETPGIEDCFMELMKSKA